MIAVETCDRNFPHCSVVADNFLHFNSSHCSEVVDEFLDFDWSDASFLEKGTPDEQKLKVDMQEALPKDVAYHRRSGLPAS